MAAHRYWRATGFAAYDDGRTIELTEFQLLSGTARVDAAATLTSSVAPISGTLAALSDGAATVSLNLDARSVLTWDFGSAPADVTDIRLGAAADTRKFPARVTVQWSDDGAAWSVATWGDFYGITWPGRNALTRSTLPTRYRIWISANNGSSGYTALTEIELRGAVGGPDLTTPAMETFQSSYWGSRTASYAFDNVWSDGVNTSSWTSADGTFPQWLGIAFPAPTAIAEIAMWSDLWTGNESEAAARCPKNFIIQGSVDGVAWRDLATLTNVTNWAPNVPKTFPVSVVPRMQVGHAGGPIDFSFCNSVGETPGLTGTTAVSAVKARPNFMFDPAANGRIDGTVKRKSDPANIPLRRRVRLYRDIDGMLIAETWSDATGHFSFDFIEANWTYTAVALDYEHNYRAVLADNLTPSVML